MKEEIYFKQQYYITLLLSFLLLLYAIAIAAIAAAAVQFSCFFFLFPLKSTTSPAVLSAVSTGGASAIFDRVGPAAFLRSGIVVRARFGDTRWFTFHNLFSRLSLPFFSFFCTEKTKLANE